MLCVFRHWTALYALRQLIGYLFVLLTALGQDTSRNILSPVSLGFVEVMFAPLLVKSAVKAGLMDSVADPLTVCAQICPL